MRRCGCAKCARLGLANVSTTSVKQLQQIHFLPPIDSPMATFQGLGMNDQVIPRERLEYSSYFTSMVLAVYDNILGPTILNVWVGKGGSSSETKPTDSTEPTDENLLMISSFSIKDEVGRESKIVGIETKFYALERMNLIACSYVFRAPLKGGKLNVFVFFVTLPYKELSQFMPRFSLCESNVCRLLSKHLISKMESDASKYERPLRTPIKDQLGDYLADFKAKLSGLCQVMSSVIQDSLPPVIDIQSTFLGTDLSDKNFSPDFLINAITCHLQLGGYSVVFGNSPQSVNKMISTLAMFLTDKERKVSRCVGVKRYIADLYLQGFIKKSDGTPPFGLECLWRNRFPTTVIDVDSAKVYFNESTVSAYLRRKDGDLNEKSPRMLEELQVFDKGREGRIIKEYIRQLQQLPETGGIREAYTSHFTHCLKLKAFGICKYLETELIGSLPHDTEGLQASEGEPKVNKDAMMNELGFGDSHIDHLILLSFAEKIRPGSYKDVIGDPQKDIEKILTDLEFV